MLCIENAGYLPYRKDPVMKTASGLWIKKYATLVLCLAFQRKTIFVVLSRLALLTRRDILA